MAASDKTIFAKIIDREIPANIVFEDDRCLAFHDINPAAPVHVLIIPKKIVDRVQNMDVSDEALLGHMFWAATQIATKLAVADGYRLVVNNGAKAGQSVFHLHMHLLAGRPMSWPPG